MLCGHELGLTEVSMFQIQSGSQSGGLQLGNPFFILRSFTFRPVGSYVSVAPKPLAHSVLAQSGIAFCSFHRFGNTGSLS
jgi:hypothetical protein